MLRFGVILLTVVVVFDAGGVTFHSIGNSVQTRTEFGIFAFALTLYRGVRWRWS